METKKYIQFLMPWNLFKKEKTIKEQLQEEKLQLSKEIDFIIESNNSEQLNTLMQNNVLLNFSQIEKILFEKNDLLKVLDIQRHVQVYEEKIKSAMLDKSSYIAGKKFKYSNPAINFNSDNYKLLNNYNELSWWFYKMVTPFKINWTNDEINHLYKNCIEIQDKEEKLKNASYGPHVQYYYDHYFHYHNLIEDFHAHCTKLYNEMKKEDVQRLAQRVNAISLQDGDVIKKQLAHDFSKKLKEFKEENLSPDAQTVFHDIKILFYELEKSSLDNMKRLDLENIYIKKLPRILSEYLIIPEKYRQRLKSDQENPDTLLLSSLKEIKNTLSQMSQEIQEDNFKSMKITNRYLKNVG